MSAWKLNWSGDIAESGEETVPSGCAGCSGCNRGSLGDDD